MNARRGSKPFLGVALLAERGQDAKALIRAINATRIARVVFFSRIRKPDVLAPSAIESIRESKCRAVMIATNPKDPGPMIYVVSLLATSTLKVGLMVSGDMDKPQTIVAAMRSGAREYLERNASPQELDLAFARLVRRPPGEDAISVPFTPPPDSGPSGGTVPPVVMVGVPRPRGPRTLPPRKELPDYLDIFPLRLRRTHC